MSEPRNPLRRVVIVGAGQVGAIAAIAVKRALPACEVTVVSAPSEAVGFADIATTALPFTNKFHDRLGIPEAQIVSRAAGSHRLITRYFGWSGDVSHGVAPYGEPVDPTIQTGFARDWGGGPKNTIATQGYGSVAEALANSGRFASPPDDRDTPLSELDYALRWNGAAYLQLLISTAQRVSVSHVPGAIAAVEWSDHGNIEALAIEGQGRLEADLFIDCSGPGADLAARHADYAVEDWSATLPIRRVLFANPGKPMVALEDRVSLLPQGWIAEIAGRDGLLVSLAVGEGVADDAAVAALGAQPAGVITVQPARCRAPWLGNVVAIGDAAARFEPLAGLPLDLAHRQIALLIELLPGRQIEPLERTEFNRRSGLMMDGARDLLAMHYAAPKAREVFEARTPEHVAQSLDQFTRRGRLPFREETPLMPQETMALLGALGFEQGFPPQSRNMAPQQIEAVRRTAVAKAQAAVQFAPPYDQWLAQASRSA